MVETYIIEIPYGKLPDGFNIKKVTENFIRTEFTPTNFCQKRSRQGLTFSWPYFTAVQGHGAQLGGRFEVYKRGMRGD